MKLQVDYTAGACVFLALLCLTVPLHWIAAFILAGAVHELGHIAAVRILGGRIASLKLGVMGAVLDASAMTPGRELVCILSGPAASFSLLLLRRMFPHVAMCGGVHGLFNLLPLYPLDGGRALYCVLQLLFSSETAAGRCFILIELVFSAAAVFLLCFVPFRQCIFPLTVVALLLGNAFRGKFSCKEGNKGVQYYHHIK